MEISLCALSIIIFILAFLSESSTIPKATLQSLTKLKLEPLVIASIENALQTAANSRITSPGPFMNPLEQVEVKRCLSELSGFKISSFGGYESAERQRLIVSPSFDDNSLEDLVVDLDTSCSFSSSVQALRISGNFMFDKSDRKGIVQAISEQCVTYSKEKIGDIMLLGETGAQMVAEPELAGSIATALKNIKTVPVIVERIELSELRLKQSVTKVLTSIEASMRLDAIASAGFGLSRSKMVKLIESGNVHVNWVETLSPAQKLQAGQVVSINGLGRLEVKEVDLTSKQRFRVVMSKST